MLILLALLLASGFVALFHQTLKRRAPLFYIAAAAVTLIVAVFDFSFLPAPVSNTLLGLFTRGAFATALWIIIMWTGALKNGSKLIRLLMPIRGELSIFAAILTLGHNIFYGKTYFVRLFTDASSLPTAQLIAAIFSLGMILLLLPLTITSFPRVRKKIPAKKWKKLQRWAYLYYGLLYAHIMLVTMPGALNGKISSIVSVIAYTLFFLSYACFRVRKHLILKKKSDAKRTLLIAVSVIVAGMLVLACSLYACNRPSNAPELPASDPASSGDDDGATVTGHAYGYDGEVYVTVTVKDGVMTDITGCSEESDEFYFNRCYEKVVAAILESQSCEVDAVSGATYSSQAIMDAVQAALKQVE